MIVAGLALTLYACSSSGPSSAPAATDAVPSASSATPAAGGESHVTMWTMSSADKAGIGAYLVAESTTGEDPLTVYVFKKDIPGSSFQRLQRELCEDVAAASTHRGRHGAWQCSHRQVGPADAFRRDSPGHYNGAPLYFSVGDRGAGDTNGQGVSASWSAATRSAVAHRPRRQSSGQRPARLSSRRLSPPDHDPIWTV